MGYAFLFSDFGRNDYFFDRYVPSAASWAQSVFWLQSEEHILDMGCLEWRPREHEYREYFDDQGNRVIDEYLDLWSTNGANQQHYGSVPAKDIDSAQAKQLASEAINQQLSSFYYAKARLEDMPGLRYLITDGGRRVGNVSQDAGAEIFRSQPVYLIAEAGKAQESTRVATGAYPAPVPSYYDDGRYYSYVRDSRYSSDYMGVANVSVYVAFSSEMVNWQNAAWRNAQRRLEIQLAIIALPALAALALAIALMAGAGRKYGGEAGQIRFAAIDRPWLDLGLAALAAYEFVVCWVFYELVSVAWSHDNFRWVAMLCAALSVFCPLPLLGWAASFAKRCKAGKWWRHTLVYALGHGVFSGLRRLAKSLWAGLPLTLRALALGGALLVFGAICLAAIPVEPAIIFALAIPALATFGLLRYSRRLHLLAQGAKAASGGNYGARIAVAGGELGSIAASIDNISDGINAAVAERLKSERLKTELITNISHDIRTPLTSLIAYADLLKSEGLGAEKAPEYLEVLIQKSARLKTLTDDLFEASKAASGNIEAHVETLDLADFARQVLGELDERVRGSGLDFRLSLPERAPVRADGKLLWRVMDNLLSNVFKYALPGSRVYIGIAAEGEWHRMDIKNISERPLNVEPSELIERFKRGDDARSGEGSGLGLSIAQSFALSQGGRFALSIDGDLFKASVSLPKP
ncbi:MAG: HAMP domain-containing histidine kinase [Clostridiales bacterium]|nr:HAMP domain-containing histidine kinase [Clostridiales bacterium]